MNDPLIEKWQICKSNFIKSIKDKDTLSEPDHNLPFDNYLTRTGELFFKTLDKIEFSFPIPDKYRDEPVGDLDDKKVQCFREYWLSVLWTRCQVVCNSARPSRRYERSQCL